MTDSGQLMRLLIEVKNLRRDLDEAIAKRKLKPPPAPWCADGDDTVMPDGLAEWVSWLYRHYPDYMTRMPRCLVNHPDAVWELATLHAEWIRVYGDDERRDLQGALNFHDKLLPGVLARLSTAIKCDDQGCRRAPPRM